MEGEDAAKNEAIYKDVEQPDRVKSTDYKAEQAPQMKKSRSKNTSFQCQAHTSLRYYAKLQPQGDTEREDHNQAAGRECQRLPTEDLQARRTNRSRILLTQAPPTIQR